MKVPEPQSCGFGNNFESFYEKGTSMNTHMTSKLMNCLPYESRFGKRKRFIQKAFKSFEKKGTKGSFTRWCRRNGYSKVTTACINRAKKNKNLTIRRKAIFAQNIRSKQREYSFGSGNKFYKIKTTLKKVDSDIKYIKSIK
jgi:hypothetical protein